MKQRTHFSSYLAILTLAVICLMPMAAKAAPAETPMAAACKCRGDNFLRSGAVEEAKDCYQKAVKMDPDLAEAWFNLAIAAYAQRDFESAKRALNEVLRCNPQDAEAYYNLGCLALYEGNIAEARKKYERASNCPLVSESLLQQISAAKEFLRRYEEFTPFARNHLHRLLADGLEPLHSA